MVHSTAGSDRVAVRLPVRHLRTLDHCGRCSEASSVFCIDRHRTTDLPKCLGCSRLVQMDERWVECTGPMDDQPPEDVFALLLRDDACVGSAAGRATLSVPAHVTSAVLARFMTAQGTAHAVVVDAPRQLVGIVSSEAAAFARGEAPVGHLARHLHPVHEGAPLAFAVERMVHERVRALPVVDDEGTLVGLLTDLDALRWVAGLHGARR
jgi:CBS domain-containing protein